MSSLFTAVGDPSKKIELLKTLHLLTLPSQFVKTFNIENPRDMIAIIRKKHVLYSAP